MLFRSLTRIHFCAKLGYLNDKRYMDIRHWLATGNYVNTDFTNRRMAYELQPFDFDTFLNSNTEFKVGAFNCNTGKTDYFGMADFNEHDKLLDVLIASSSLPFMSNPSVINQNPYLNGGIGEPIPLAQPLNLSRLDCNIGKVTAVYQQGLADGQNILPALITWLAAPKLPKSEV